MTTRGGGRAGRESPGARAQQIQIPDTVSEFYANSVFVGFGAWDFTLFFGTTELPSALPANLGHQSYGGDIRIDALVRMSPQHAKAMARSLNESLTRYEEQFGELRIPDAPV